MQHDLDGKSGDRQPISQKPRNWTLSPFLQIAVYFPIFSAIALACKNNNR